MLQVAADELHLAATRQQALSAAGVLVTGETGDALPCERLISVFDLACEYARGEHDGSAMDDMTGSPHPLSAMRISFGDATLAADGLRLAARASRTPDQHATVADLAAEITRSSPAETVLAGVAHALTALPSLPAAPHPLSIPALALSESKSLRAVGAVHWALASADEGPESDGIAFAKDTSPLVRGCLARQLAIVADRSGLSCAGQKAAAILAGDPRWGVRTAACKALASAATTASSAG